MNSLCTFVVSDEFQIDAQFLEYSAVSNALPHKTYAIRKQFHAKMSLSFILMLRQNCFLFSHQYGAADWGETELTDCDA